MSNVRPFRRKVERARFGRPIARSKMARRIRRLLGRQPRRGTY